MIYLYNETKLTNLKFVEESYGDRSNLSLRIESEAHPDTPYIISLLKTTSEVIINALHSRYGVSGVKIDGNFVRDYLMVRDHRILMNPETDELVDLGNTKPDTKEGKNLYVKNMVVLILNKDSKYFIKKKNTCKKPQIVTLTDDGEAKVVIMYIKTNNWSRIPANDPLNILIMSGYGADSNVEFKMTSVASKSNDNNEGSVTTRHHNLAEVVPYTGEFPVINPVDKDNRPATDSANKPSIKHEAHRAKPEQEHTNYNDSYTKKDNHRPRKESYSYNSKDYDDERQNSKKYNGHPKKKHGKKNKRFNGGY